MTCPERKWKRIDDRVREKFLEVLALGWTVSRAAELASHARREFYRVRSEDAAFAEAWDEALEAGTQVLEDEARRRAVEGVERPIFQGGEHVGTVREYSDGLLMFLLRARRPEAYRENAQLRVTGADGGPVQVEARQLLLGNVLRQAVEAGAIEHIGLPPRVVAALKAGDNAVAGDVVDGEVVDGDA